MKVSFNPEFDFKCECGVILHNCCKSSIKTHKGTARHRLRLLGLYKPKVQEKIKFEKKCITIIFD